MEQIKRVRKKAGVDWRHDLVGAGYGSLAEVEQMSVVDVLEALDAMAAQAAIEEIVEQHYKAKR